MTFVPVYASSPWGFRMTPVKQQCQWLRDHDIKHICGQFLANQASLF